MAGEGCCKEVLKGRVGEERGSVGWRERCGELFWKGVAESCCREALEKSVVEKRWRSLVQRSAEWCCREVLQTSAVEKRWRRVL